MLASPRRSLSVAPAGETVSGLASTLTLALAVLVNLHVPAAAQGSLQSVLGHAAQDFFGGSCAGAGDVDGDGRPDVIVGSPGDDSRGADAGGAFVYSGRTGALLLAIHGDAPGDRMGISVSGAGDLDGDGHADLLVGAHRADVGGLDAGLARAVSGRDGSEFFTLLGSAPGDVFGLAVAGAGDLDGDAVPDLAVGAPLDDAGTADGGSVRVVSGADGHTLFTVLGLEPGGRLGFSLAGLGDTDGDGVPDLLAGAPVASGPAPGAGHALLLSGAGGAILRTLTGDAAFDAFGTAVSSAGDLDADGRDDLLVGARYHDGGGLDAGLVRAYSGADGHVLRSWSGASAGDELGIAVAGVGDLDGDGTPDVAGGAWAADGGGSNTGSTTTWSGADGQLLWTTWGDLPHDELGWSVAGAGDVNGDGRADVIGGIPGADALGQATGGARIYSGSCGSITSYGSGSPGSGGFVPALSMTGCAVTGGGVTLLLGDALGGAPSLLVLGPLTGSFRLHGCELLVAPPFTQLLLLLPGAGPGGGSLTAHATWPPGSSGLVLALQLLVADTGAGGGLSSSNGLLVALP